MSRSLVLVLLVAIVSFPGPAHGNGVTVETAGVFTKYSGDVAPDGVPFLNTHINGVPVPPSVPPVIENGVVQGELALPAGTTSVEFKVADGFGGFNLSSVLSWTPAVSAVPSTPDGTPEAYTLPNTQVREIQSSANNAIYRLFIATPADYATSGKRYPVVYMLDADYSFALTRNVAYVDISQSAITPEDRVALAQYVQNSAQSASGDLWRRYEDAENVLSARGITPDNVGITAPEYIHPSDMASFNSRAPSEYRTGRTYVGPSGRAYVYEGQGRFRYTGRHEYNPEQAMGRREPETAAPPTSSAPRRM